MTTPSHRQHAPPIPEEVLGQHIGILGKTGSGKSNAAKTIVEQWLDRNERVCIIDPTNSWWGLRLSANGQNYSPYSIPVLGGDRGDVAIGGTHGRAIAEAIGRSSSSAIISTRHMSVKARTAFFADFAEALLQLNRGLLHLVLDEAHLFMPQGKVMDPESGRMLHAANELVSEGRGLGLQITLISQRPAKVHKDSLSQVETLVAMRLIAPHDVDQVEAWWSRWAKRRRGTAGADDIIATLPELGRGDAFLWSPEIGVLERVHFPLARTFDSGKPAAELETHVLGEIDIGALRDRLTVVEEETKANDPKLLRAEIVRLRAQLQAQGQVDGSQAEAEYSRGLAEGGAATIELRGSLDFFKRAVREMQGKLQEALAIAVADELQKAGELSATSSKLVPAPVRTVVHDNPRTVAVEPRRATAASPARRPTNGAGSFAISPYATSILAVLAACHPMRRTVAAWATLAGRSIRSSAWNAARAELLRNGLVEDVGGLWCCTEAGRWQAGDVQQMPSDPPALRAAWIQKLSRIEGALITALAPRHMMTLAALAEAAGYSLTSSAFAAAVSSLRKNQMIVVLHDRRITLAEELAG